MSMCGTCVYRNDSKQPAEGEFIINDTAINQLLTSCGLECFLFILFPSKKCFILCVF